MNESMKNNRFCGVEELAIQSNKLWRLAVEYSDNDAALGVNTQKVEEFWDEVAERTQKKGDEDQQRINDVFFMLCQNNAFNENTHCLDVGCGRGTFAIEFAKQGAKVDCLDMSQGMLNFTCNHFEKCGLARPQTIQTDWQNANIKELGLENKYDLVFASLNPSITNPEALDKMTQASKNWCMYLYSAGGWLSQDYDNLDQLLFGRATPISGFNEICFAFNHLYRQGLCPKVDYTSSAWYNNYSIDEAVNNFCKHYSSFTEIDAAQRAAIEQYVHTHSNGLVFCQHFVWKMGMLLWHVKV